MLCLIIQGVSLNLDKLSNKIVTISKFSYENPRYINLLKRRSNIPEGMIFTKEEIGELIHFQEQYSDSEIVM